MVDKEILLQIIDILADVVQEQAIREYSGRDWGNDTLSRINDIALKIKKQGAKKAIAEYEAARKREKEAKKVFQSSLKNSVNSLK